MADPINSATEQIRGFNEQAPDSATLEDISSQAPALTITIDGGNYIPDAETASVSTEGGYWAYGCVISYEGDPGLRVEPVAAANRTVPRQVSRVHSGACRKIIAGVAMRTLQTPSTPSRQPQSDNEILVSWKVVAFNPQLDLNGSRMYGLTWEYIYELQVPPGDNDMLDSPGSPMDPASPATRTLNPADFKSYITGIPSAVSGPAVPVSVTY